jgi:hypothetical protein
MRRSFLILCCLLFSLAVYAQEDSIASKQDGIIAAIRKKINETKARALGISQIKHAKDTSTTLMKDSLSTISAIASKADSVTGKVNGLMQRGNELRNRPLNEVNSRVGQAEVAISQTEDKVTKQLATADEEWKNAFSKATDGEIQAPTPDAQFNTLIPIQDDIQLKTPDRPEADGLTNSLKGEAINIKLNLDVGDVPAMKEISNFKGELDDVDGKLETAQGYEEELRKINETGISEAKDLPADLEQKATELKPLKDFNSELQKVTAQQAEYEALIQKYKDKKALQEEILRKTRNVVNDKLNEHSAAFKEAQEKLAKVKKLNPAVQSFKEIKKKRENEMKGKSFIEHLVPGVSLQAFNRDVFKMDIAIQTSYRFTGRLAAGIGGGYQIGFSEAYPSWVRSENLYGYRTYVNYGLFKAFYGHGEFAANFGRIVINNIESPTNRFYSGNFGLGRRYDISRKLRGSILVLYHANIEGNMPAFSKVSMRVEFNLNTKKRKKIEPLHQRGK